AVAIGLLGNLGNGLRLVVVLIPGQHHQITDNSQTGKQYDALNIHRLSVLSGWSWVIGYPVDSKWQSEAGCCFRCPEPDHTRLLPKDDTLAGVLRQEKVP